MKIEYERWSLCRRFGESIKRNGGGASNINNFWYISQIEFYCHGVGWDISEFIDLEEDKPQLITAVETDISIAPLPIIQFLKENKCQLETCNNQRIKNRKYCSDDCRVIFNNLPKNRKRSKKIA